MGLVCVCVCSIGDEASEAGRGQIVQDFYAMSFLRRELHTRGRDESSSGTVQTCVL